VLLTSSVASTAEPVRPAAASEQLAPAPVASATPSPAAVAVARAAVAPRPVAKPSPSRKVVARVVRTTTRRAVTAPRTTTARTTTTKTSSSTAQPWGTNDYPYRNQSDFYAIDRWGFTERQCVSFAAWRLAQHGDTINNKDNWGSAYTWDEAARRLGFGVSSKARVGAVAQWNAHESGAYYSKGSATANGKFSAGGYGHVGWVKAVYSDGSALVEQYNMGGDRAYSVMRVKAPRYLLIG
jgi:surface antigen